MLDPRALRRRQGLIAIPGSIAIAAARTLPWEAWLTGSRGSFSEGGALRLAAGSAGFSFSGALRLADDLLAGAERIVLPIALTPLVNRQGVKAG